MNSFIKAATLSLVIAATPIHVQASEVPHQHDNGDSRILHFHYQENEVFELNVNFRFITQIQFGKGESVKSIQLGDSVSFQVQRLASGDIVTVKPLIEDARTNMNIITSKRVYTFYLKALPDGADNGQNFRIFFKYGTERRKKPSFTDLTSGTKATGHIWNTNYELSGKADFAPLEVYDDGVNTWIRYNRTARRPAVFSTNSKGEESVVNYTAHPDHLIQLHGLSNFWSLRIDGELVCIRKRPAGF